jgi:peptidoglycan/xylan/chitin deacetylase (PgdA/CDA1 family)
MARQGRQARQGRPDTGGSTDPLEQLLGLLDAAPGESSRVQAVGVRDDHPTWLIDRDWRIFARPARELIPGGREVARFDLGNGSTLSAVFDGARKSVYLPFSPAEAYVNYVSEAWKTGTPRRGLSTRQLQAYYLLKRYIPRRLQIQARRLLIRRQGLPEFPRWPLDLSVSRLLRFYTYCRLLARGEQDAEFRWFWPEAHEAALILTHDVETAEGLRLAVELADLEEAHGYRSCFNLGGWYDVDLGIVRELTERGFEIGLHGLRHDRTLFSSRAQFEAQLLGIASLASRLGAEGFRSPATYRVFEWLAELAISYDGSISNSDPFEPQPGGSCSVWPFFIGGVVELPYTLPQDYTLFTLLGHRSPALWLEQADRIVEEHGLIHALSHPDRGYLGDPENRDRYREFLVALSERGEIWKPLPRELASWWRLRAGAEPDEPQMSRGVIRVGETADEVDFQPPRAVERLPGKQGR